MTNEELANVLMEESKHQSERAKNTTYSGAVLRDHSNAIEAMARVVVADALANLALRLKFP